MNEEVNVSANVWLIGKGRGGNRGCIKRNLGIGGGCLNEVFLRDDTSTDGGEIVRDYRLTNCMFLCRQAGVLSGRVGGGFQVSSPQLVRSLVASTGSNVQVKL